MEALLGAVIAILATGALALTIEYAESTMTNADFQQLTSEEVMMIRTSGFSDDAVRDLNQHLRQEAVSLMRQ